MRHTFISEQWVPHPIETVFAFFANPENLPGLMPAWQKARIEQSGFIPPPHSKGSEPQVAGRFAGAGSTMTISFQALPFLPIRMKWEALIVEFEWNRHFCDEQPKGPFAYWRHCHQVTSQTQGAVSGTRVVDNLIYALPFGILAEPAHALFVRRQIESIFAYRQKRLLELLV